MSLRLRFEFFLSVLLVVCLASGCSSGDDDDDVSDDDDDSTPYVKPGPWQDMSFDEREEYMREVVEPTMEALFAEYDPESFGNIGCSTCHGQNAADNDYAMPNGLEPLDVADFPLSDEIADFMDDEVKPAMAELLDQEPFPQGEFGCFNCHEQK